MSMIQENISVREYVKGYCALNIASSIYNAITLEQAEEEYSTKALYFDPSYQRIYGSWRNKQKSSYIESIFNNFIYTPIVLVPLTKEDKEAQGLPDNLEYACLDGQHRSTVIAEFVSNEFGINAAMDLDGKGAKEYNNILFKDLSNREQLLFLQARITIHKVTCMRQPLEKIFLAINDGAPLNGQEKRNAVKCEMSEWSRDCASQYTTSVFSQIGKIRKTLERMSAHLYCSYLYSSLKGFIMVNGKSRVYVDQKSKTLDEIYISSYRMDSNISKYIKSSLLNSLVPVANHVRNNRDNQLIRKSELWVYTILHSLLFLEEDNSLLDIYKEYSNVDLWEAACNLHLDLVKQSMTSWSKAIDDLDSGFITEAVYANKRFFHIEISRIHLGSSFKLAYQEMRNAMKGDVTSYLRSQYSKKMQNKLKKII